MMYTNSSNILDQLTSIKLVILIYLTNLTTRTSVKHVHNQYILSPSSQDDIIEHSNKSIPCRSLTFDDLI